MDDLISRQATIRFIRDKVSLSLFMKRSVDKADKACMELCDMLDRELPSAQPEPQWIPCSERLPEHPENGDYYLVAIQCEHYDGWDDYVTGFAEWTKYGWDELSCYIGQIKVVAWMPLPEPYKGGENK